MAEPCWTNFWHAKDELHCAPPPCPGEDEDSTALRGLAEYLTNAAELVHAACATSTLPRSPGFAIRDAMEQAPAVRPPSVHFLVLRLSEYRQEKLFAPSYRKTQFLPGRATIPTQRCRRPMRAIYTFSRETLSGYSGREAAGCSESVVACSGSFRCRFFATTGSRAFSRIASQLGMGRLWLERAKFFLLSNMLVPKS